MGLRGAAPEEKFTCGGLQRAVMTAVTEVVTVCVGGGGGCRGGDRGGDDGVCGDSDGDDGVCCPSKRTTVISCGKLKHRSGRMASLMTHDHNDSEYCKHLNVSTDGV